VQNIHSIAQKQHGLLTRAQALVCGLSDGDIRGRLNAGIWLRVYAGVYRVAGSRVTHEQAVLAAVLAAGGQALASHGTAAEVHGLPGGDGQIHITVVGRRILVPGVKVHVVTGLQVPDCAVKNGIPVTTVARTIIDLAQILSVVRLEEVLDHALAARLVSLNVLQQRLEKTGTRGRRGAGLLAVLIGVRLDGSPTSDPAP
jgi:predicted transcriptional regulator of viral defense system